MLPQTGTAGKAIAATCVLDECDRYNETCFSRGQNCQDTNNQTTALGDYSCIAFVGKCSLSFRDCTNQGQECIVPDSSNLNNWECKCTDTGVTQSQGAVSDCDRSAADQEAASDDDDGGCGWWCILLIIIGALLCCSSCIALLFLLTRKKKKEEESDELEEDPEKGQEMGEAMDFSNIQGGLPERSPSPDPGLAGSGRYSPNTSPYQPPLPLREGTPYSAALGENPLAHLNSPGFSSLDEGMTTHEPRSAMGGVLSGENGSMERDRPTRLHHTSPEYVPHPPYHFPPFSWGDLSPHFPLTFFLRQPFFSR